MSTNTPNEHSSVNDFRLAEYNNLRAEIGIRLGLEFQIISLTIIALGTVIALGIKKDNIAFILFYPVLIMFLSAIWRDNQLRIEDISTHIQTKIANQVGTQISWELSQKTNYYSGNRGKLHGTLSLFGKRGAFIGNELLVIVIALTLDNFNFAKFNQIEKIALGVGIFSFIATCILLSPIAEHLPSIIEQLTAPIRSLLPSSQPTNLAAGQTSQPTNPAG